MMTCSTSSAAGWRSLPAPAPRPISAWSSADGREHQRRLGTTWTATGTSTWRWATRTHRCGSIPTTMGSWPWVGRPGPSRRSEPWPGATRTATAIWTWRWATTARRTISMPTRAGRSRRGGRRCQLPRHAAVAWGDWDRDGDLDLAVGHDDAPIQVYENNAGVLGLAWTAPITRSTQSVAWADWDNDGYLDLAAGNDVGRTRSMRTAPGRLRWRGRRRPAMPPGQWPGGIGTTTATRSWRPATITRRTWSTRTRTACWARNRLDVGKSPSSPRVSCGGTGTGTATWTWQPATMASRTGSTATGAAISS